MSEVIVEVCGFRARKMDSANAGFSWFETLGIAARQLKDELRRTRGSGSMWLDANGLDLESEGIFLM